MKKIIFIFLLLVQFLYSFSEASESPLKQIIEIENAKQSFSKMMTSAASYTEKKALAKDIKKKTENLGKNTYTANSDTGDFTLAMSQETGASVMFYFDGNLIYDEQFSLTNIQQKMITSAKLTYKVEAHPTLPSTYIFSLKKISFLNSKGTILLKKEFVQKTAQYQYPILTLFDPKTLDFLEEEQKKTLQIEETNEETESDTEERVVQGFFINFPISVFAKNGKVHSTGIGISADFCFPLNVIIGGTLGVSFEESNDFDDFLDFLGLLFGNPLDDDFNKGEKHGEYYGYVLSRFGFYVPTSSIISFKIFSQAGFFAREPVIGGGMNFLLHKPLEDHTTVGLMLGYSHLIKPDTSAMQKYSLGLFFTQQY